jgi:NAD(P)H-flavin reductase
MDVFSAAQSNGVRTVVITELLSMDIIKREVPDAGERLAYISGPHLMVENTKLLLRGLGVKRGDIKTDFFSGY